MGAKGKAKHKQGKTHKQRKKACLGTSRESSYSGQASIPKAPTVRMIAFEDGISRFLQPGSERPIRMRVGEGTE